ncbi:hypothetical protein, conserved [Leishmania tarentolae]|uniref:MSP domain-containing protein n=1 Tax=Leishmania tarentolae TaxID=5689 RepID=A0A640KJH4_LEITA|nr:hypothetical protein, conserved [Leishmania tarentolae]
MPGNALPIKLSQDSLFFPLPFTNATIDNVVQVKNMLPAVQGDPKANVISFKILSRVQNRYSVHPPVGFIGAGEHATIVFSFNPEHVKMAKNPQERELPTEATKDAIHVDFAVVDAQSVQTALAHWVPGRKETKAPREVIADASQFWKQRGQVTKNSPTSMRHKLRCIFATRNNVPDSLVMCMKEEGGKCKPIADGAAPLPRTRPPVTPSTQPHSTAPPETPPHRYSESRLTTPTMRSPSNDVCHTGSASGGQSISTTRPGAAAAASASSGPPASLAPTWKPSTSAGLTCGDITLKSIAGQVMNYKLSYRTACVLLFLTLLCGLLDQSNILTWMIANH